MNYNLVLTLRKRETSSPQNTFCFGRFCHEKPWKGTAPLTIPVWGAIALWLLKD